MNLGQTHIFIGLLTIFIAIFALFYIFNSLESLAEQCQSGVKLEVCNQLSSFTIPMMIILLTIGGFVLIICIVVYIMLS